MTSRVLRWAAVVAVAASSVVSTRLADAAATPASAALGAGHVLWTPAMGSASTPPTVTIDQAGDQGDPTNASPIRFTVVFSAPVTGFTGADVRYTGSTAPGSLTASVSG